MGMKGFPKYKPFEKLINLTDKSSNISFRLKNPFSIEFSSHLGTQSISVLFFYRK